MTCKKLLYENDTWWYFKMPWYTVFFKYHPVSIYSPWCLTVTWAWWSCGMKVSTVGISNIHSIHYFQNPNLQRVKWHIALMPCTMTHTPFPQYPVSLYYSLPPCQDVCCPSHNTRQNKTKNFYWKIRFLLWHVLLCFRASPKLPTIAYVLEL